VLARVAVIGGAGGPAGQQGQGVLGGRPGLGGVADEAWAEIRIQGKRLVRQVEVSDDRMVDEFDAGAVDLDVMRGPSPPEVVAAGGEFPDEVGEAPVEGEAAGLGPEQGDRVVGGFVPIPEEAGRVRVDEPETRRRSLP
jgi:hypothetical protein